MLNPRDNRLDYGDQLRPPEGFQLSAAIATTYTLDLETVLALPIAMSFNTTLEGNLQGENMALLEAISDVKDRFRVFFQQGNIHLPQRFNRLFTLLEPCLSPVTPDSPYSAFHPKIWLMRFVGEGDEQTIRYRLIVLTRNLTFDTSWDIAVTLEGYSGEAPVPESHYRGVLDLLDQLPAAEQNDPFTEKLNTLRNEIPKVRWELPRGFKDMETRAGIPGQKTPVTIPPRADELLIMSPFLHAKPLDRFAEAAAKRYLLSEPGPLDEIQKTNLEGWHCYTLNGQLQDPIDYEEAINRPINTAAGLHAKLFMTRKGRYIDWFLGSANATTAALGSGADGDNVQNTEFMLKLSTTSDSLGPSSLLETLAGTEANPTDIFVPHEFTSQEETGDALSENLRPFLYHLTKARWQITATPQSDGYYRCGLSVKGVTQAWPDEVEQVKVGLLAQNRYLVFSSEAMEWREVSLTQLSRFMPLIVTLTDGSEERLVIKADLHFEGSEDPRVQQIFHEVLHNQTHFMAYIRMLLAPEHQQSHWLHSPDITDTESNSRAILQQLTEGPVFESLLLSSGRTPEKLARIGDVVEQLEAADATCIPDDFKELWEHFRLVAHNGGGKV